MIRNLRLRLAHRLLRSCSGRLGTPYARRAYRIARFLAPEPARIGKDIL